MLLDSRAAGYSGGQNMVVLIIRFAVAIGIIADLVPNTASEYAQQKQEKTVRMRNHHCTVCPMLVLCTSRGSKPDDVGFICAPE